MINNNPLRIIVSLVVLVAVLSGGLLSAGEPSRSSAIEKPVREIFVPYDDLDVILEGKTHRVFLERKEFEELLAKAKTKPADGVPHAAAFLSASYHAMLGDQKAVLSGSLVIDVLQEGLHVVPLVCRGVGIRRATLDGQSASLGQGPWQGVWLFVEGKGQHQLELELVAPLGASAAQQTLQVQLPSPPAAQMNLTVPGNVELKGGADVIQRSFVEKDNATELELLLRPGPISLVLSLNNRSLRRQQVVVARSVVIDELTSSYERLHATVSLNVLHGAAEMFRFQLPEGFDVTEVKSPLLSQWLVKQENGQFILEVQLRQPTREQVVLNIAALRPKSDPANWTFPRLTPLDVAGQIAVFGVLAEDQLKTESLSTSGLIPIDTVVLLEAIPDSVFEVDPGAPPVRPVLAYYAPQSEFEFSALFKKPTPQKRVTTNLLLILQEDRQVVQGGFAIAAEVERLFFIDFSVPTGWDIAQVTGGNGQLFQYEEHPLDEGGARIRVRLPQGISPGEQSVVNFEATRVPTGWLGDWENRSVELPVFNVLGATQDQGAVSVQVRDDLKVRPETLKQLTPLDEKEKARYQLKSIPAALVYRYESHPYAATLAVERTEPRMTARTHSFFQVRPDGLSAHYELSFDVQRARTREVSLLLPLDTPKALSIKGLDGVVLKEFNSEEVEGKRRWTALLADKRRGKVRLSVDFEHRFQDVAPKDLSLPIVLADGVAYQSGKIAVEGTPELDVAVKSALRKIDVGELLLADYQLGQRLLASYGFVGDGPQVQLSVTPRESYALPVAIVQSAEIISSISDSGQGMNFATYQIATKASFLELQLPQEAKLWSVFVDAQPAKPRRDDKRLLISLPARDAEGVREIKIAYEMAVPRVWLEGDVDLASPRLYLPSGNDSPSELLPVADLLWKVHLPTGYHAATSSGTVYTEDLKPRPTSLEMLGVAVTTLGGGTSPFYSRMFLAMESSGVDSSMKKAESPQYEIDKADSTMDPTSSFTKAPDPRDGIPGEGEASDEELEAEEPEFSPIDDPNKTSPGKMDTSISYDLDRASNERSGRIAKKKSKGLPWSYGKGRSADLGRYAGIRSLEIQFASGEKPTIVFRSLGVDPHLSLRVVNHHRFAWFAGGVGLALFVIGLALTQRPTKTKIRYVLAVMLVAAALPLVIGWQDQLGYTFDAAFFAAVLLVPYYLLVSAASTVLAQLKAMFGRSHAVSALLLLFLLANVSMAAAAPPRARRGAQSTPREKLDPVKVPEDAIIVPYDATSKFGIHNSVGAAERLLVPYDKYVELWNRAYPDKKISSDKLPASYALAGGQFRATLRDEEYLQLDGHLDIDVFAEGQVSIPLPFSGGVLTKSLLDGKPAQIQLVEAGPTAGSKMNKRNAKKSKVGPPVVVVHVSGKGRKRLELSVHMRLTRQGGWRIASGYLPSSPAMALSLSVPSAKTEIRLRGISDRSSYETAEANEAIETVLGPRGHLHLQWRPVVGAGQLDQSLTATSQVTVDVQEDALHVAWGVDLAFGHHRRDSFSLTIPQGYTLGRVEGPNVRGWESRPSPNGQRIDVNLLKAVSEKERLTLHLVRRGVVSPTKLTEFDLPTVAVSGAVLHRGRLLIRRSPLLSLQTRKVTGLTRADLPQGVAAKTLSLQGSPLGVRPCEAYQFSMMPFSARMSVRSVDSKVSAELRSVMKISSSESTLETKVDFDSQNRPVYRIRIAIPQDLKVNRIEAPGDHQWSISESEKARRLTIYMTSAQSGKFSVVLRGTLLRRAVDKVISLPEIKVLDMARQRGDLVVQIAPAFDLRPSDLSNCQSVLLSRTYGWLQSAQRRWARLALQHQGGDYSGKLHISVRRPRVLSDSISNVRITDRAVVETILLQFDITDAGIRQLSLLLPEKLKDAQVRAPLLRMKTVEPAGKGLVRFKLEFQDEVIGQLRVLVDSSHLLGETI